MLLAWSLLVTLVATFAVGLWLPITDALARNRAKIVDQHARIAKVTKLAAEREKLLTDIAAMTRAHGADDSERLFMAKSPALGVADLQRRALAVITRNAGQQVSSQPQVADAVGEFHKLTVTVNLSADLPTIRGMLYDFETEQPRIFVEQLMISSHTPSRLRARMRQQRTSNASISSADALRVRLLLTAYMHTNEASDEAKPPR